MHRSANKPLMLPRLKALSQLTRLHTTFSAPLVTGLGWYLAENSSSDAPHLIWSAVSAFCVVTLAQVFNDIRDFHQDSLTKPTRPLPAGLVSMRFAWQVVIAVSLIALGAALLAGIITTIFCLFSGLMSVAYSMRGKSTVLVGNLIVAVLSAGLISFSLNSTQLGNAKDIFMETLIFLFVFGNELFKTCLDEEADATYGVRTIATQWPIKMPTRIIQASALLITAELLLQPLVISGKIHFTAVALITIAIPAMISGMILGLVEPPTPERLYRAHRVWKLGWVPGIVAGVLLR